MNLVWLSDGTIETVWPTDSLQEALTSGRARIESPPALLGMIMYQWEQDGQSAAAEELKDWLVEKGIGFYPIHTPHDLLNEDKAIEEESKPEEQHWVEVELTEEGIDLSKVEL
jgi:hypothetical protein